MKTIYTLAIALMSGVILTACVGAVNIGGGTSPEFALINRCIVGNTAQADPTCAKAVADTNGCINNPFSSGCEANPLFSPHVQNARDERVKFCNDADNSRDSLCTGSDSEKDICTHDPFGRVCDSYSSEREVIVDRCIQADNTSDKSCKSAVMTYPCIANPFGEGCNTVLGNFNDNDNYLDDKDGVFIIERKSGDGSGVHVFAGRFETTDVGDALTETTPIVTFRGNASVVLVHAREDGLFSGGTSLRRKMNFTNLELTANFTARTLRGNNSNSSGDRLMVDGKFNGERISGNVTMTFVDSEILKVANRSDFTANLTGVIGEDGAVGVFNSHLTRGHPSDYALGGGFVVKPISSNP